MPITSIICVKCFAERFSLSFSFRPFHLYTAPRYFQRPLSTCCSTFKGLQAQERPFFATRATEFVMPISLTLPAPAKINRMLHITGKRSDGYHNLQTLFQFLKYGDELTFTCRDDDQLTLAPALADVEQEHNLIIRAARLLQHADAPSPNARPIALRGADITLIKRIPMGGGLGGGSSDAATTLLGLNRLWQLGMTLEQLAALGTTLGADVPVFVHGFAAWGEGIGDKLTPAPLDTPLFCVIYPGIAVVTAEVFRSPELTRYSPVISMEHALRRGRNDCEPIVRQQSPAIAAALDWLNQFGEARLTGTGSCIILGLTDEREGRNILLRVSKEHTDWQVFLSESSNISPLHATLNEQPGMTG